MKLFGSQYLKITPLKRGPIGHPSTLKLTEDPPHIAFVYFKLLHGVFSKDILKKKVIFLGGLFYFQVFFAQKAPLESGPSIAIQTN